MEFLKIFSYGVSKIQIFRRGARKSNISIWGCGRSKCCHIWRVLAKKIVGGSRMSCRGGGVSGVKHVVKRGTDVFTF